MATFTSEHSEYLGKAKRVIYNYGRLSLVNEGGTKGDIPASLFGMRKIHSVHVSGAVPDIISGTNFTMGVYDDGSSLFFSDFSQAATIADLGGPEDAGTVTLVITVIGE